MPVTSPYQEDQVLILDKAIELMQVEHAVVELYQQFITDKLGMRVSYGDPAACRFCVAGVVEHAAMLIRRPGQLLLADQALPMWAEEQELIAAACQVEFYTEAELNERNLLPLDRPAHAETLIEIFDRAWRDGEGDNAVARDLDTVRESVIEYLQRGRDEIERQLKAVEATS